MHEQGGKICISSKRFKNKKENLHQWFKCPSFYQMTFTILMNKQDVVIASLNISSLSQGIQGVKNCCDILKKFRKTSPQLEVILFQEHHMGMQVCLKKTSQMNFKGGVSFWNDVLISVRNNRFKGTTTNHTFIQISSFGGRLWSNQSEKGLILDFQIIISYEGGGNVYLRTKLHNKVKRILANTN